MSSSEECDDFDSDPEDEQMTKVASSSSPAALDVGVYEASDDATGTAAATAHWWRILATRCRWFNPLLRPRPDDFPDQRVPLVTNVWASCRLGMTFDLGKLSHGVSDIVFNPLINHCAVMRLRAPYCSLNVYANGTLTAMGLKNEHDAHHACRIAARKIQRAGFDVPRLRNFKITSVSAVVQCVHSIDLPRFAVSYEHLGAYYEPALHNGATWSVDEPTKMSCDIFQNGKIVFKGAKRRDDIYTLWKRLNAMVATCSGGPLPQFNASAASVAATASATTTKAEEVAV